MCMLSKSAIVTALSLLTTSLLHLPASAASTERVSVSSSGVQGNAHSVQNAVSAYGRYVAFQSEAGNLVPGDNGLGGIYVRNRRTGITRKVSVSSSGDQANHSSVAPTISAGGRFVAFLSVATNLVSGDTNGFDDIFVHDRTTGITLRVNVSSSGSQANGSSLAPAISPNGRYVAFSSDASNLVTGDTNGIADIFVHDRTTGITRRVSVSTGGSQSNDQSVGQALSANGRYVAFSSDASNLVSGDTNGETDIFVHDRTTGITRRVSIDSSGNQANRISLRPTISGDGRYVAFGSGATNLVIGDSNNTFDVFVHDRTTGATRRVSVSSNGDQADSTNVDSAISTDGRYVAFASTASNLVPGDTNGVLDIFVHDRVTGITRRVSVDSSGDQSNDSSFIPSISPHGRYVAFTSDASNLVPADTNSALDVFIRDRRP